LNLAQWYSLKRGDLILSKTGTIRVVKHNDFYGNVKISKLNAGNSTLNTTTIAKYRRSEYQIFAKIIPNKNKNGMDKYLITKNMLHKKVEIKR
jgi:hypothetical protein